ncbi:MULTISPECIES: SDR family NAD(P)-dependent oxidoreductase [unclassified Novosphingobium]|uniref:SDR family NAD(P)-dependent oxidoreductase n=1 Tax=unclassified Novosphingobium TaxID=2644732 RepID=UPI0003B5D669|nr:MULTISPECIES: SDR family oxidoreductase [unclassified Novosphingobium]KPF54805.1 3-ketoacyl-ACP reductase [Novosphingobium sp. AAP1]MBB3358203.1 NAD(P)-dependent dehydrogenase (short-subunit alcohol dehydrogenase family) [Novosphingobium sp. BK256]MBB3374564.1 NAD(P)-dependent dehydrogenase (short-subunit alcohol dehydrogenase family) [Novosphingobium sp. BK280]MBB3378976.1 NAD(P)-dependent dehydrogenase (short-subunit alcohol dehydrogenase family) [Novosphingobium sp. BK258]MBB3420670.1 NA
MDLGLKGKKVILTGGSRGIGRATVELFAAEGADVAFCSRNAEQVAETAAALAAHGGKVFGSAFDMESGHDAYRAWLTQARDALGGCDIFVPMISTSGAGATGDWQKSLDYDIMGLVIGVEVLEEALAASGEGSIVVTASTAGVETFIVPQGYNALKGALLVHAGQLSQALGAKGIRVNSVSPGPIRFPGGNWEAIEGVMPELYAATQAQFVLGRWGGPEEVARTVVFLASPASSFTTGTNVVIDGGYTKRVQF